MLDGIFVIHRSSRNLAEMMVERGLSIDHSTIYRWVIAYSTEINQRCRKHLRPTNDSIEQDHRYTKGRVIASQHFRNFWRGKRTIAGYESMNMMARKPRPLSRSNQKCKPK
jgi:transposase-like protein